MAEKNFIVFCGFTYYASPGWQGFHGRFETLAEAVSVGEAIEADVYSSCGWWQVVDLSKDEIVAGEGTCHTGLFGRFSVNPAPNQVNSADS